VERGGRGLLTLGEPVYPPGEDRHEPAVQTPRKTRPADAAAREARLEQALGALAEAVRAGQVGKLAIERIDGEPAIGSRIERVLLELGFHSGPRRLTLSA
jgi:hypothetical protein